MIRPCGANEYTIFSLEPAEAFGTSTVHICQANLWLNDICHKIEIECVVYPSDKKWRIRRMTPNVYIDALLSDYLPDLIEMRDGIETILNKEYETP